MEWIPFSKADTPRDTRMIWLDDQLNWFEGKFVEDPDYGLVVETDTSCIAIGFITHYLIVKVP